MTRRVFCSLAATLLALVALASRPAWAQPVAMMGFGEAHVEVSASPSATSVAPGDRFAIAVVLDHAEGYHAHTHDPQIPPAMDGFPAIPTTIELQNNPALTPGRIQWPEEHTVQVDFGFADGPVDYRVYSDRAIAYLPLLVADDAPEGELTIELVVGFQACNDTTCDPPSSERVQVTIQVSRAGTVASGSELFAGFDPAVYADASAWGAGVLDSAGPKASSNAPKFLGLTLPESGSPAGMIVLALLGAVGGFVLNLTPCVLPMIPLKVMTISRHAGEDRSRALALAVSMALGVVAFWAGIGVPVASAVAAASEVTDPSKFIFGRWYITLAIGVIILGFGVGIMGLFNINLPQGVYKLNPKADSLHGSFLFGIMTAVLGLPCFGFVAGALLAGASAMPPLLVITIFVSIGVGMALPYLVLALRPKLVERIPRTGPASDLVKQVMGLLMLAAAAYFIGTSVLSFGSGHGWVLPWWGKAAHWWVIGAVLVSTGLWMIVRTYAITKRAGPRLVLPVLALMIAGLGGAAGYDRTVHEYHNFWVAYWPDALDEALARGDVVVLDFTAEWCLNCKTLEATVLSRSPVKPLLLSKGVVPMVADVTSDSAPGWEKIRELDQVGIPLLAVFAPGHDGAVWMSNAYTGGQVVEAIEQAHSGVE